MFIVLILVLDIKPYQMDSVAIVSCEVEYLFSFSLRDSHLFQFEMLPYNIYLPGEVYPSS